MAIDTQLIKKLVSPATHSPLQLGDDGSLVAQDRSTVIEITDGIPVFWTSTPNSARPAISCEVSVLIMARNEGGNIGEVVRITADALSKRGSPFEIIIIDGASTDDTVVRASEAGARVIAQQSQGYAQGLLEGLSAVRGRYVVTLDGDCSHDPALLDRFLAAARPGTIVVGSRWMAGGGYSGPLHRGLLSRALSLIFSVGLRIPLTDLSSGYRVYARETIDPHSYSSQDFSILLEMLIRAVNNGYEVTEVPLHYQPRKEGSSKARLIAFGRSYLTTLRKMWLLRNDGTSADYEDRAFNSLNLIQRWWQRRRFSTIRSLLGELPEQGELLDIGCGSSKITQSIPSGVAFDSSLRKLRFLSHSHQKRVCGSAMFLPFAPASFDVMIHSQTLQHLPKSDEIFAALHRILRPEGILIIGTVDSSNRISRLIHRLYRFFMPYASPEISSSHSPGELIEGLARNGFSIEQTRSILATEIIIRARRRSAPQTNKANGSVTAAELF